MARRAYGIKDKKARRGEIVEAARALFADGAGELPSVARIAEAAGLGKGTLYLYFPTREAIFADLLLEGWSEVLRALEAVFAADGDRAAKVAAFLAGFTAYLDRHPELLRLDALGHGIERNLDRAALHAFKASLNDRLASGGAVIQGALGLAPERGVQLLMRTYALTRGLWLAFGDAGGGADAAIDYRGILDTDFRSELAAALAEYWRGALSPPA